METPNEVTDEPGAGGATWPTDDLGITSWVNDRKKKAESRLSEWYEAARKDFGFYENKQWSEEDVAKMESEKRVAVTFNRVAPIVNSICGQEVSNRQEVKFLPRKIGEVSTADPMNDAVRYIRDNCNAEDEDSDAFKDMVICGMGWTVSRMDYEENPDGEGRVERRDPLLMRWDPAARRKNLADKKWIQSDYWMTKDAIEARWPDADLTLLLNLQTPDHQSPHDSTESWKYKNDASGHDSYGDQWRVIHHVETFTKPAYRVVDPATQKLQTFSESDFKKLQKRYKVVQQAQAEQGQMLPDLQSNKTQQRVYWEAWTVGKVVLQSGVAKVQKDFQYQAMTCFRERESGFWFGVVRLMLDPQRYANRMASLLMSILATGAKGGVLFETGAFVNPQKAKKDWARWDSAIELSPGALAAGKVQSKQPVQLPQGASDLMQFAITSIRDVTGANVEMLGSRQEDQPGVVEDMRTKAGLTILAPVFDAMRLYRKRQGVVLAEFVTKFLSDGRLIRIWGQQGQQFIPLVRDPESVEYDTIVDESPASRDVKERTWMVLGQIMPFLQAMGIPPPPSILDYAPIPESLATDIKKALFQRSQQPPQPPPEVQKAQIEGQIKMQQSQAEGQAKMQQAQIQAQLQEKIELAKAQKETITQQAQLAADVQTAREKAAIEAQLERERMVRQEQLEREKADLQMQIEMRKAALQSETSVRVAQISAGVSPEDQAASQQRVQQEQSNIEQLIGAVVQSHVATQQLIGQHAQHMAAAADKIHQAAQLEHVIVRDKSGRGVGRKPVPPGTLRN